MKLRVPLSSLPNGSRTASSPGNVQKPKRAPRMPSKKIVLAASQNKDNCINNKRGRSFVVNEDTTVPSPTKPPRLKRSNADSIPNPNNVVAKDAFLPNTTADASLSTPATSPPEADVRRSVSMKNPVALGTEEKITDNTEETTTLFTQEVTSDDKTVLFSSEESTATPAISRVVTFEDEDEKNSTIASNGPMGLAASTSEKQTDIDTKVVFDYEGRSHHFSPSKKQPAWLFDYWQSQEANKLFVAKEGETAKEAISRHIEALENFNAETLTAYCGENRTNLLEDEKEEIVTTKASYVLTALYIAREELENCASFINCCREALLYMSDVDDIHKLDDAAAIYRWFADFRNDHKFKVTPFPGPFWESTETRIIFGVEKAQDIKQTVTGYVLRLQKFETEWKSLVVGGHEQDFQLSDEQKVHFRTQVVYVVWALTKALSHMPNVSWIACCQMACNSLDVDEFKASPFKKVASANIVKTYFREFRRNGGKFIVKVKKLPEALPDQSASGANHLPEALPAQSASGSNQVGSITI